MSDVSHQKALINTLEQALIDARSGRLLAFAFAGIGHDEHVLAYSFDDLKPDDWLYLVGALDKVRSEVIGPSAPHGMQAKGSKLAELFEFVKTFADRDPAFAKGVYKERIAEAKRLVALFTGASA